MATRYSDIIRLREGKAAYSIAEEKSGEWQSFIPNGQFNGVLRTVLKSVRGNSIDYHKSFWLNGTYGTGKSHAVAVVSHLLGDDVRDIRQWVDYEYDGQKYAALRQAIYELRKEKRLLTVKLNGIGKMSHVSDLALTLQTAVADSLHAHGITLPRPVPTDFDAYVDHITHNADFWEQLIGGDAELSSAVADSGRLASLLRGHDLGVIHRVAEALRKAGLTIRLTNASIKQWLVEVQDQLAAMRTYDGLLIVWDEFTDVMTSAIGLPVLKELQVIAEKFANEENNSFFFLISHPSAFDKLSPEQMKQTDGRYFRMKYNMETVSAFKIMSRKFQVVDEGQYGQVRDFFYSAHPRLLDLFTASSNDPQSTREDLLNLFPLHPGTANLATYYATVVGSSSRSVFEFLGQNEAVGEFLDSEAEYLNRHTITADYLWDFVLSVFQDSPADYGAVLERFNSYRHQVGGEGGAFLAVFKGILLLNAFNNVRDVREEEAGDLVIPSEDNIHILFEGTQYDGEVDKVLQWLNTEGIIQRAPGGLYSVEFTALPSGEVEAKKAEMRNEFRFTQQILTFSDEAEKSVRDKFLQKVIRPYRFRFYSDVGNNASLRSQIKNGRREAKGSELYFALLMSRDNDELARLRTFAEAFAADSDDKDLKNIVLIVFDETLGGQKYNMFIEFQANYACASSHGFVDQQKTYRDHAVGMVGEWMDTMQRGNATIYINGQPPRPVSVRHLSSTVNADVGPAIFPYGPDAHAVLRQRTKNTFWNKTTSKVMVRTFLFATSMESFDKLDAQMKPVKYLLQDCLDDNLRWRPDTPPGHPLKKVCDKVESIISHADKSLPFNFDEKFAPLSRPPYGLYRSFAAMGMMAFALRPWADKIYDQQGKPRDKNALVDDICLLFDEVWDKGKSNNKLDFKFQTPEEGKLCKALVSLFGLNAKGNAYRDVTSLKDARYAITAEFLGRKNYPLWSIKYAPKEVFAGLPVIVAVTGDIRQLTDDITKICMERDLRNPALVNETLYLIDALQFDMRNILNVDRAFSEGFKSFLMGIERVGVKEDEIGGVRRYIERNLQSTVGYWTEDEVRTCVEHWRLEQQMSHVSPPQGHGGMMAAGGGNGVAEPLAPPSAPGVMAGKRARAKARIATIQSLDEAKALLSELCDEAGEWLLDRINGQDHVQDF